jgi:lysine-N-methylase
VRPILLRDAFLRLYIGDVGRRWVVVRHEQRMRIGALERRLLAFCDGERDFAEVALALESETGERMAAGEVRELLAQLVDEGFLVDADAAWPRANKRERGLEAVELTSDEIAALRVVVLDGAGFDCDGRGGCCRLYERLLLSAGDVARVRSAYEGELVPGGLTVDSAIQQHRSGGDLELAVVDGRCVLLEPDGACGLHRKLGAEGKPRGCRTYPLREVLCEDVLDVALAAECRCVVDFADGPPLDPLVALGLDRLALERTVLQVRAMVPMTLGHRAPRAEYVAWRRAATERLNAAPDVAGWALGEAAALLGRPPRTSSREPLLDRVVDLLRRAEASTRRVYSEGDLLRQTFAWAYESATRLAAGQTGAPVRGERLLARHTLHAHALLQARTLAVGLFGLGLRLELARAGAELPLPEALLPVTIVEYLHRVQSLAELIDDAAEMIETKLL